MAKTLGLVELTLFKWATNDRRLLQLSSMFAVLPVMVAGRESLTL